MGKKKNRKDNKEKKQEFEQFPDFGTMKKFVTGSDVPKDQSKGRKTHDPENLDDNEEDA